MRVASDGPKWSVARKDGNVKLAIDGALGSVCIEGNGGAYPGGVGFELKDRNGKSKEKAKPAMRVDGQRQRVVL